MIPACVKLTKLASSGGNLEKIQGGGPTAQVKRGLRGSLLPVDNCSLVFGRWLGPLLLLVGKTRSQNKLNPRACWVALQLCRRDLLRMIDPLCFHLQHLTHIYFTSTLTKRKGLWEIQMLVLAKCTESNALWMEITKMGSPRESGEECFPLSAETFCLKGNLFLHGVLGPACQTSQPFLQPAHYLVPVFPKYAFP